MTPGLMRKAQRVYHDAQITLHLQLHGFDDIEQWTATATRNGSTVGVCTDYSARHALLGLIALQTRGKRKPAPVGLP